MLILRHQSIAIMNIENIVETFCKMRNVQPSELFGGRRQKDVWNTRYMVWHYLHYELKMSANKLSVHFNRNRPSIFRGIRIIKHQMMFDKDLRKEYHRIIKEVEGASNDTPSDNINE